MPAAVIRLSLLLCLTLQGNLYAQTLEETTLTLQDAVALALEQHPRLQINQADIEAAEQRVWRERTAYLPRGGYRYNYSRRQIPITTAVGGVDVGGEVRTRMTSQTFNFHNTNFGLSQLLFDFGRTLSNIRAAAAEVAANKADLNTTRQNIIFTVKQAYYGVLSARHLRQVAEETIRQNQRHVEEAEARFDGGLVPRFDVTQAQVQLSNAELDFVVARNNVDLARETLRTAIGVPPPVSFLLVDALSQEPLTVDDENLLATAYNNRPELQSLQAQQLAAAERVSALRKQYLPSVTGDAEYNWTGREYPLQDGWNWAVTLNFPLFDDFETTTQLGEAKAGLRRLKAQEKDLRLQIALEVRQGVLTLQQTVERIRVTEQALGQARENLTLAEGRYSAGVGNIIELTGAQVLLTTARANNVRALYDYRTAIAQLEQAVGQSLE